MLKTEERRVNKKNSPRKRTVPRSRLQITKFATEITEDTKVMKENIANNNQVMPDSLRSPVCCSSPGNLPHIKKALNIKCPKRLHRTPVKIDVKHTPIRAVSTPKQ